MGFWNRFADRYAARPIKDTAAYEALLADVAGRLHPTDRVLEIGCGTGGTAIRLAPVVAQFIATDFSAEMVRIANAKPAPDNLRFADLTIQTPGPFLARGYCWAECHWEAKLVRHHAFIGQPLATARK